MPFIPQQLFVKVGRGLDDLLRMSIRFGFHGSTDVFGSDVAPWYWDPGAAPCVGWESFADFVQVLAHQDQCLALCTSPSVVLYHICFIVVYCGRP